MQERRHSDTSRDSADHDPGRAPDRTEERHAARGREARSPRDIPRAGWRDILLRTKREVGDDQVGLISAAVAFYLFLALFPALAAAMSIHALIADPAQIAQQIERLTAVPAQVRELLSRQLERQAEGSPGTLSWTLAGSLLFALWSGSKGMRALTKAVNIAYDEDEERGFVARFALSLAFTGGAIVIALLASLVIVAIPAAFSSLGLGGAAHWAGAIAAWVVLLAVFVAAIAALYRWGPNRSDARWRWLTPGAGVAALLWLVASALFSLYVANFGRYDETYGSLAAVVVLLLWLWMSSFVVIVGAELDAEIERQTRHDSTTGAPEPRGSRGAHVADNVGRTP